MDQKLYNKGKGLEIKTHLSQPPFFIHSKERPYFIKHVKEMAENVQTDLDVDQDTFEYQFLIENEKTFSLFAYLDDQIVGFLVAQPTAVDLFIRLVYVDKDHRGKGIFKRFIEHLRGISEYEDKPFIFGVSGENKLMGEILEHLGGEVDVTYYSLLTRMAVIGASKTICRPPCGGVD